MTATGLKLAVFDCDGTLVDSLHSIVAAMHQACDEMAVARPEAGAIRRMIGLPLMDVVTALVPSPANPDDGFHQRLRDRYADAFHGMRKNGTLEEPLFPGVLEGVTSLEATGWLLGVATGKSRRGLDATLARHGLGERFVTLQTADRARGKPHPEMLELAMAEAGVGAADTVMIGDTTFDMEMATSAGVRAIGVSWGYHAPAELVAAGAEEIADGFGHLVDLLGRRASGGRA